MNLYFWRYVVPSGIHYTEQLPFFEPQKAISLQSAVVWCESYRTPGSVSVRIKATPELIAFLWDLNLIITRNDSDRVMLVEDMEMESDSDGDYIRITGESSEALTKRRIIMQRGAVKMNAQAAIIYYIQENLGAYWYDNASDEHPHGVSVPQSRRFMNLFDKGHDDVLIKDTVSADPFGRNLGDFITEICTGLDFGFRVLFDGEKLRYSCYKGLDRTLNQSERNAVVFSEDFRNVSSLKFRRNLDTFYSHIIAGGSGTGSQRQYNDAYSNFRNPLFVGMNLREKFINASGTADSSLGYVAQNAVLAARKRSDFDVDASSSRQFLYRRDYFLGDRVSVVNRFGVSGTATVSEVVESEDADGFFVFPKLTDFDFGDYVVPKRPQKLGVRFLEYIKNVPDTHTGTGWPYILTDIIPDYDTRTELDIKLDSNTGGYVNDFMCGYYYADCAYSIDIWTNGAWLLVTFFDGDISGSDDIRLYPVPFDRLTAILERGTCRLGDASVAYAPAVTAPAPASGMPFFARIYEEGEIRPMRDFLMRLYSAKLYKNGALLHHLVPAEREADGVAGLFDNMSGKFYPGTGTFEKGDYIQ